MQTILGFGKYLFALPFLVFGILHFMNAEGMAPMAFGSAILVYVTGAALIAASLSMLLGKYDKLAAVLLGAFLLLTAFLIHLNAATEGDMGNFLKDLMLAGAAWMYATTTAKDASVIG